MIEPDEGHADVVLEALVPQAIEALLLQQGLRFRELLTHDDEALVRPV